MAPLPKRKHSTARKGKRLNARKTKLAELTKCKKCGELKLSHRLCRKCGK